MVIPRRQDQGADINAQDEFYQSTPLGWALYGEHADIVILLLGKGAEGADRALITGVRANNKDVVAAALKSPEIDSKRSTRTSS